MVQSFVKIMDRQGKLKGDLNLLQRAGLFWLMNNEVEEQTEMEKMRLQHQALASNPTTSPKYLENLFEDKQETPEDYEWITPQTLDEVDQMLKSLNV